MNTFKLNRKLVIMAMMLFLVCSIRFAFSTPVGPAATQVKNETRSPAGATLINTSGGSITTLKLNATMQNLRWKAYVGNVTGSLVLDNAGNYSIYEWELSAVTGEVYATRSQDIVQWSTLDCSNETHMINEEIAIDHTDNPDDNITATFSAKDHDEFYVGTELIEENSCFSLHTFVNDSNQSQDFEEIIMYDGTTHDNGDIVYASLLEQDAMGFDNQPYDFQMIVPENGGSTWTGSTPYYFYVELT